MKKQLVTSIDIKYVYNYLQLAVVGEVFYTRRTRILNRLVRKVIHTVIIPFDSYDSAEEAKKQARKEMDQFVYKYYQNESNT